MYMYLDPTADHLNATLSSHNTSLITVQYIQLLCRLIILYHAELYSRSL